jgi:hypothetical protein
MSDLETKVLAVLAPMIQHGTATKFSLEQATTLSAWSLKTAMVFDLLVRPEWRRYTAAERGELRRTAIAPLSMYTWLGLYRGQTRLSATDWWGTYTLTSNAATKEGTVSVASISMGCLFFQVASFQGVGEPLGVQFHTPGLEDALVQVWPIEMGFYHGGGLRWPPPQVIDDPGFVLLRNRFAGVKG